MGTNPWKQSRPVRARSDSRRCSKEVVAMRFWVMIRPPPEVPSLDLPVIIASVAVSFQPSRPKSDLASCRRCPL
eukprot:3943103-Pyramimonas_sp.AAC.1